MKNFFAVSLILCFSCAGDADTVAPGNLIPAEKMTLIIVDLQILESHFQRMYQRPDLYKNSLDSSSTFIFEKYQVSKGAFDSSYNYYMQDVDIIYGIYEAALDSINFRMSQPQQ